MLRRATCRLRMQSQAVKGSLSTLQDPRHTWQACSSPASFSGLQEGHWLLTLRATDAAGLTRQSRRVIPLSGHAASKMPTSCYRMHACQSRRKANSLLGVQRMLVRFTHASSAPKVVQRTCLCLLTRCGLSGQRLQTPL